VLADERMIRRGVLAPLLLVIAGLEMLGLERAVAPLDVVSVEMP
jgi:hypothetical protein